MTRLRTWLWRYFPRPMLVGRYIVRFRRLPRARPRTFTEKMLVRLLTDRDPRLALFADKVAVREYVTGRLADDSVLTRLYAVLDRPEAIRHLALPDRFVMKPNHLSGAIRIVRDGPSVDRDELMAVASRWLARNYGHERGEWAYRHIPPRVIFEELLETDGRVPDDYKIFCFAGKPVIVRLFRDRFGPDPTVSSFDAQFRPMPLAILAPGFRHSTEPAAAPPNFERMMRVARTLAADVDFVRVDLYNLDGRVVFGELTNYPGAGGLTFVPSSFDLTFGGLWPDRGSRA